jgi:hypothetical protein
MKTLRLGPRRKSRVRAIPAESNVPSDLETICLKCLQKDPARRYGSAEALAQRSGAVAWAEPILARPVGQGEKLLALGAAPIRLSPA